MQRPRRSVVVYSVALLGVGVATAIRYGLDSVLGEQSLYPMYFLAVSVAGWAGGIWPAMFTALFSCVLANYLFSQPRGHFQIKDIEQLSALIVFLLVSLLISILYEISLKALARAQAAEQQKDDFLAVLAHELRNPLAVIHYTNLERQNSGDGSPHDRSEVIDRQVQQLDQMIDDLADISRVSRGKFRLEFEPISVASVVDRGLEIARRNIRDRDHELILEQSTDDMILWGDPLRLEQIVANLLRNASRYSPRGSRIELRTAREKDFLVLRIRDNGQGIPRDLLSRVFDLRTQIERSLESSGTGLGVGLALVRTLVELHGGTVAALSDGPDRGSEFIVRLPLYHESVEPG